MNFHYSPIRLNYKYLFLIGTCDIYVFYFKIVHRELVKKHNRKYTLLFIIFITITGVQKCTINVITNKNLEQIIFVFKFISRQNEFFFLDAFGQYKSSRYIISRY